MTAGLLDRLLAKTVRQENGCLIFVGARNKGGYGKLTVGGKTRAAHRIAYELAHGELDPTLDVCHRCDTPSCVEPAHLFMGTTAENVADMTAKGRRVDNRGEDHGRALLTEDDVHAIRRLAVQGVRCSDLARRYSVSKSTVHSVVKRRNWAWLA